MPAAAVIPAPIAYIKVVAVKKLVVGFLALRVVFYDFLSQNFGIRIFALLSVIHSDFLRAVIVINLTWLSSRSITLKKLECSKQAYAVNTLAWNNEIGLWSYFVGSED